MEQIRAFGKPGFRKAVRPGNRIKLKTERKTVDSGCESLMLPAEVQYKAKNIDLVLCGTRLLSFWKGDKHVSGSP